MLIKDPKFTDWLFAEAATITGATSSAETQALNEPEASNSQDDVPAATATSNSRNGYVFI